MTGDDNIGDFYDEVAEQYADEVVESPIRRHCRLPAVQSLLPEVEGKRVLDAACGTGTDAGWLAEQGASVLGIDASDAMLGTARERFGDVAEFREANLEKPLDFLGDGSVDIVWSQLTLSHLENWDTVLGEFARVLVDGGTLVASTDHPFRQFRLTRKGAFSDVDLYAQDHEPDVRPENDPSNYYETERYDLAYGPDGSHVVTFYRRPMSAYLQAFLNAGFALDDVVEPVLLDEFQDVDPEAYNAFSHREPDFLCLRATKSPRPK